VYEFNVTETSQMYEVDPNREIVIPFDDREPHQEIMGEILVSIESYFQVEEMKEHSEEVVEVLNYFIENDFAPIDLDKTDDTHVDFIPEFPDVIQEDKVLL
jgi:hypothetical protein